MKNKVGKVLFFVLLTCSSCSSIYRFSVDIQEPALITLPISAQNVLILDNAITQPENDGVERTSTEQSIHTKYSLSLDSMVWTAIDEIAAVLDESHFFNTIAIYRKPLRTDTEWQSIHELSKEEQSDFYDTENFDALFVIDRLLFSVNEEIEKIQTGISFSELKALVDLRADGMITCSMYLYGKEKPLTTFTVSDSLFANYMIVADSTTLFKVIPEYALNELSRMLGNNVAKHFIPTWKMSERILFTGYNSRMQEATSYAADHQWAKAESIWTAELGKRNRPTDKAKITFNIAVANEMQDKFDPAFEWAQKAKEHLKNANPNSDGREIELTDNYISELAKRIQNNRLLDVQWGKE